MLLFSNDDNQYLLFQCSKYKFSLKRNRDKVIQSMNPSTHRILENILPI